MYQNSIKNGILNTVFFGIVVKYSCTNREIFMEDFTYNQILIEKTKKDIENNPENIENDFLLGKLYIVQNDYDKALLVYEEILSKNSNDVQALVNAGSINFYNQNYDKAISYYKLAVNIEQLNYSIH